MALRRLKSAIALLVAACPLLGQAVSPSISPHTSENDRLIETAKLWITVKYFHPYVAYHPDEWDKALIGALPKIRSAQNAHEYASALRSMIQTLHDGGSAVLEDTSYIASASEGGQRLWIHHGLPPESGSDKGAFYSGFVYRPEHNPLPSVTIPLGNGVRAVLALSDPSSSTANPYPPSKRDAYPDARYPSTEYRILAAFKTWGAIHYFFAYRDLMDEDWDEVFSSFLPRFIAAKDAREYNLTLAELLAHTLDSHVTVTSQELSDYFGPATVGLRLRLIERKPVVTEIFDENAKAAGLRVGDVVSKIDGEAIAIRFNRIQDYVSGSTFQRRGYDSLQRVLNGPEGSTATLLAGTPDGATREVKLQRSQKFLQTTWEQESTDNAIRILPAGIGYVDLTRIANDQVPAIFEKLQNTRAIIFDARGEVRPAAQRIASHLTSADDVAGAIITGPVTLNPDVLTTNSLTSTASYFFVEKVPPLAPKYEGKTVMLIDERTIGAAEHLGLWLEAANNTTFIGTASAGADGETSNFVLPGGITVAFSGQDVRHGNSGKLQRLGLQPTVVVAPTVNGIRRGRDEVLEKAIEYLSGPQDHRTRAAYPTLIGLRK